MSAVEQQPAKESRRKPRKVGPFSRERSLMAVDGRTQPGRLLRKIEADLIAQLGHRSTPSLLMLARSAALKATRITMLAKRVIEGDELADGTDPQALAWMNGLRADLTAMGLLPNSRIPKSTNAGDPDDPDGDLAAYLKGRPAG